MQVPLLPGMIGPVLLTDGTPLTRKPITQPFLTTGLLLVGAMVEIDTEVSSANITAKVCYRFWATDNSDSTTAWTAYGGAASPANLKAFATTNAVAASANLMCQLGLEVERTGVGPDDHVVAYLRYPVAVY